MDSFKEYNSFLEWFEVNHPALFDKYQGNITISPDDGHTVAYNNNNKIFQHEFEKIGRVVKSYTDKKDLEEFDTIDFRYAPDRRKDEVAEANMKNASAMWLRSVINQINRQRGVVVIFFTNTGVNGIGIEHVTDELKSEVKRLVESFYTHFYL